MRIVFLSPSGRMGGAEVALLEILISLRKARPDWKLDLIVSGEGPLAARAKALGVTTTILPFPQSLARIGDAFVSGSAAPANSKAKLLARLLWASPAIANYGIKLRRELRRGGAAVIHSNGFKMHLLGSLAKRHTVPLIWHVHDYVSNRPLAARLMKRLYNRCAFVLVNSNSVKRDVEDVCGTTVPIQTLYNAVDTTVFSAQGAALDLDELCGLPPPAKPVIRVGLLATFARWKGQEVFLRAVSLIPASIPLRAYIIGDALYQTDGSQYSLAELQALVLQLGISDRVGFAGFVAEPAAALRSLDVVVHASTQPEPFGMVIIEGMACGRAVIASEAGGAAELIRTTIQIDRQANLETEINALGHSPGDAAQLAERIIQLATDPALRARLGAAGRATVEQRFNSDRLGRELSTIYQLVAVEFVS